MEQQDQDTAPIDGVLVNTKVTRRSWTAQQKRDIVAEAQMAGADAVAVAGRYGVRVALLTSWRRQVLRTDGAVVKGAKFAAVSVSAAPEGVIEVDLDCRCVRVRGIVDARMLCEVMTAAR